MKLINLTRIACVEWHTIFPWTINQESSILDLGANRGRFSEKMNKQYSCSSHAVEASPDLYQKLKLKTNFSAYHYAITDCDKPIIFHLSKQDTGSSTLTIPDNLQTQTVTVSGITLESFLTQNHIDKVDLIKMDIEGAEIQVFDSITDQFLEKIPQITVEFHDFCNLTKPTEVSRIVQRLQKLGFLYLKMSKYGNQDVLFINRNLIKISMLEYYYIKYIVRYLLGITRVLLKLLPISPDSYPYYS